MPTNSINVTTGTSISGSATQNSLTTGNVWGADIQMIPPYPVLTLTKACASGNIFPGTSLTYLLSYGNSGNGIATNVLLSDVLPINVNYVPNSATCGGSFTAATHTLTWSLASLSPGQSGQLAFQVTASAGVATGTEISNTATIMATEVTTPVASNVAVVTVCSRGAGDWWMYRHDPRHSGRSAHAGPAAPVQQWAFPSKNVITSSPACAADGTLYVGSEDDHLYAIAPDGSQRWVFATAGGSIFRPVGADNTIYLGSGDQHLYALNPDGTQKWVFSSAGAISSSPLIAPDGTLYVGSADGISMPSTRMAANSGRFPPEAVSPPRRRSGRMAPSTSAHPITICMPLPPAASNGGCLPPAAPSPPRRRSGRTARFISALRMTNCMRSTPAACCSGPLPAAAPSLLLRRWERTARFTSARCDHALYALNPDNTLQWSFATGGAITSSPAIDANGIIYFGSGDTRCYAITPGGTQQWAYGIGSSVDSSPVLGANGTLYVGAHDGKLYAISAPTFTVSPSSDANGTISPSSMQTVNYGDSLTFTATAYPNYTEASWSVDGTPVQLGGSQFTLYDITADHTVQVTFTALGPVAQGDWWMFRHDPQHTGRSPYLGPASPIQKWVFDAGYNIYSSPALGADGTIYLGAENNLLYAVTPDGSLKWAFPTQAPIDSSPAIGADGTIYIGSEDSNLYAVNADGTQQWAFPTLATINSSPALKADGTIYIGLNDGNLYALNPDGTQQWAFATSGFIQSSPAIGTDGTLYIGSADSNVYAINADGTLQWGFPPETWSPPPRPSERTAPSTSGHGITTCMRSIPTVHSSGCFRRIMISIPLRHSGQTAASISAPRITISMPSTRMARNSGSFQPAHLSNPLRRSRRMAQFIWEQKTVIATLDRKTLKWSYHNGEHNALLPGHSERTAPSISVPMIATICTPSRPLPHSP